ncbi:hypothetical protein [Pleionea sediminis]|uniref:hypothetical protein n=1 Tax=Pleionea sediminis TaxID=2569479 RepID=UPI0011872433|nr:hypothetical protein [Pleionea sediminis]
MRNLVLVVTLLFIIPLRAGVLYDGKYYLKCETCSYDYQYQSTALNHFFWNNYEFNTSTEIDYVFLEATNFIDVRVEDITDGSLGDYLTIVTVKSQKSPIYFFPIISSTITPINRIPESTRNQLLDTLVEYKGLYQTSTDYVRNHGDEPFKATSNWSTLILGKSPLRYEGNTHFIDTIKQTVNQQLQDADFNPFLFADKPLSIEWMSADDYIFTFIQSPTIPLPSLTLFSIEYNSNQSLFVTDEFGNIGSQTERPNSALCVFNGYREMCRSFDSFSQTVYGNRTTIYYAKGCPDPACPAPEAPTSCPPGSSQYCKGSSSPPTPPNPSNSVEISE